TKLAWLFHRRALVISLVCGAALAVFNLQMMPVIAIAFSPGHPDSRNFTLNYSDPRGYKYTVVDSRHCVITIRPGGFNHLQDYSLELRLSPHLEFADVFFDQNFQIKDQLFLQSSNTNDVLILNKQADDFAGKRIIKFTYKYRTPDKNNFV